jgi:beta-lactamase superfamily II metal-dependent hydrolase
MSSERSRRESQDRLRHEHHSLRLHVFHCSHGDTVLIELPENRWALVDCHLPNTAAIRRFLQALAKLRVDRLDYVFLSHPHYDHYAGMRKVLDHFTRDGRSVGWFCDVGASPVDVTRILEARGRPDSEVHEYVKLTHLLKLLISSERVGYRRLDEGHAPLLFAGSKRGVQFIPVGPSPHVAVTMTRSALAGQRVDEAINRLSVVFVLQVPFGNKRCQVLLGADAESEGIRRALGIWQRHPENPQGHVEFKAVKVPHHGSANGHCPELVAAKAPKGEAVAVISVGTRFRASVPSRRVIEEYQQNGWIVLGTTTRRRRTSRDRLVAQFGRGATSNMNVRSHDIRIRWSLANDDVSWQPHDARIESTELAHYPP